MSIHPTRKLAACRSLPRFSDRGRRGGFTLVELLIVITIIGVLVGLLVPAAAMVRRTVQQAAIAMEVQSLANAIEQYKNKYGEYPPDGSSSQVFERHCRKVWSNMAPSELALLTNKSVSNCVATILLNGTRNHAVMDPAEALVFFLGGFSADETHPFTGPGGPIFLTNSSGVQVNSSAAWTTAQYNVDRNDPLYDFNQSQLTLEVVNGITISTEERDLFAVTNANFYDRLPVYRSGSGRLAPFVYFDSRTNFFRTAQGNPFFNAYAPVIEEMGVARPYKSAEVNTTVQPAGNMDLADKHFRYMNERSFQIISAGLDDSYGGIRTNMSATRPNDFNLPPTFFVYPTGQQLVLPGGLVSSTTRYFEASGIPSTQLDNATNFSDGILAERAGMMERLRAVDLFV